jgi:serine protease AprX
MKFILRLTIAAIILLNGVSHQAKASVGQTSDWQAKVDPWVLQTSAQGETEFLIFLAEQADVSGAAHFPTRIEKGRFVLERLNEVAQRTQPGVVAALKKLSAEYRTFRVANMIWARGSQQVIRTIAERADVARLYANPQVKLNVPATPAFSIESAQVTVSTAPQAIEWNIAKVNAPQVWAEGFTGQGAVIAGADTGYEWNHPALIGQYRGWNGLAADHDYNWHDAIHHNSGPACLGDSTEPCDVFGHGTHTMGTMVGDDGGSNQIGMAPGAKWIGCRNMDNYGNGTPASYTECFDWFLAPYPVGGDPSQGDPTMAPDVINNSWTCTSGEGCSWDTLLTIVNNVRAAGIVVVAAASNNGSSCFSITEPPALYDASFSVGATNSSDIIASFSSRGPITIDGSNRIKPDISAPGVSIRSCTPGPSYGTSQGTSMAAPHVAGLVGLLISADPALRGQVDEIETLIEHTAVPRTTTQNCGVVPGTNIPNNTYGWGRIDALAAYQGITHQLSLNKTASAAAIAPGEPLTYTLTITHTHVETPTTNLILTDTIPSGTAFLDATRPYSQTENVIEWNFPSLGVNESASVTLTVGTPPTITGAITNAFYGVRSEDVSTVSGDPVVTAVVPYTLTLTKTAPDWIPPGDLLAYHLTVANPHPFAPVHNLVLSDTIPANTTFVAATQPYSITDQVINWRLSDLAAGSSWSITLTVQSPLTFTGTITNSEYGITSDEFEGLAGPPVRTEIFGLMVEKIAAAVVKPDELLTYTLTVTNLHPSATTYHLVLSDTLPAGTQFVTATLGYTLTGDQVVWDLDHLAAGGTWQVLITVQVNTNAAGTIRNVDYAVRSDEVTLPVAGTPVETLIRREVWLPLILGSP